MNIDDCKQKLAQNQKYRIILDAPYGYGSTTRDVVFLSLETQGYRDESGMWTIMVTDDPAWFLKCRDAYPTYERGNELVFLSVKAIRSIGKVQDKDIGENGEEVIDVEAVKPGPNVFQKVVESGNTDSVWGHLAGIETFIEQGHTEYCACHMHNGGDSCQCQKKPVRAGTGKVRYE